MGDKRLWLGLLGFIGLLTIYLTIAYLCKIIALGDVEEKSSFGLAVLLVGLIEMAKAYTVAFVAWAFELVKDNKKEG